jgi:hypothetical protein
MARLDEFDVVLAPRSARNTPLVPSPGVSDATNAPLAQPLHKGLADLLRHGTAFYDVAAGSTVVAGTRSGESTRPLMQKAPPKRGLCLVMHEDREQEDDRQRHAEQPKQRTSSKAHGFLLWLNQHQQNDQAYRHSEQPQQHRHRILL